MLQSKHSLCLHSRPDQISCLQVFSFQLSQIDSLARDDTKYFLMC